MTPCTEMQVIFSDLSSLLVHKNIIKLLCYCARWGEWKLVHGKRLKINYNNNIISYCLADSLVCSSISLICSFYLLFVVVLTSPIVNWHSKGQGRLTIIDLFKALPQITMDPLEYAFFMHFIAIFCNIIWSCFWYFGLLLQDLHWSKILNFSHPDQPTWETKVQSCQRPNIIINRIFIGPDPNRRSSPCFPLNSSWVHNWSWSDNFTTYHLDLWSPHELHPSGLKMKKGCAP